MNVVKRTSISIIVLFFTFHAYAQQLISTKLDSLLDQLEVNNKWMGSIALSKNGKLIYQKATGIASEGKRATVNSRYRIGSITKAFVATLTVMAVEEKKLTYDEKLSQFFPAVKNAEKITIEQMLNHHSGLPDFADHPAFLSWMTQRKSHQEILAMIGSTKGYLEPGTRFHYSNTNYVLLGYILEKIYNKPLKKIFAEKIGRPLGLKHTYFGDAIDTENDEVNSYFNFRGWQKQPETNLFLAAGAAGMVSDPADLNLFITGLFNGKLVSSESLLAMKKMTDGYGFGLKTYRYGEQTGYGHVGGIDGFSSLLYYFPGDQLSVAITSNGNLYDNGKILLSALNAFYEKPFFIPEFKLFSLKSEDLNPYLGVYGAADYPFHITITKKNDLLILQIDKQSPFLMDATGKDHFEFSAAGLALDFNPMTREVTLTQGHEKHVLSKK